MSRDIVHEPSHYNAREYATRNVYNKTRRVVAIKESGRLPAD